MRININIKHIFSNRAITPERRIENRQRPTRRAMRMRVKHPTEIGSSTQTARIAGCQDMSKGFAFEPGRQDLRRNRKKIADGDIAHRGNQRID